MSDTMKKARSVVSCLHDDVGPRGFRALSPVAALFMNSAATTIRATISKINPCTPHDK